jgi:aspartyl-tRNA(Asn)/glutamyl-tRNA(Gln) amidotransferase subunit A
MSELHKLTIAEARARLEAGELTARELTEALLDRIVAVDNQVKAYLAINDEEAIAQAEAADRRIKAGQAAPLTGIPLAIKDVFCTRGLATTCGSRILENFVPPYDATVTARLREAGAVFLGKVNMDEFAMGSSTENSAFFPTRNPWDLSRVPGGSSGGSGAAVAAREALGALGTDTGGSVRLPASFCGITGLKPTYGRVSRYGLVAYGSSLDQAGPMTRTVADAALILQAIAGHDPYDGTTARLPVPDYAAALTGDVRGLRIGVPDDYFVEGMDAAVEKLVREAIAALADRGADLVEISLPHTQYALPAYYIIAPAEVSTNLARFDGIRYGVRVEGQSLWDTVEATRGAGLGAEARRRIMLGTYALSSGYYDAYYRRAQQVRTLVRRDFEQAWERCDLIAAPTAPMVAFKLDEKMDDPLTMYLVDVFTLPVNLAGLPGMALPCGFSAGMPVGLQLIGRQFDEPTLLRVGEAYQRDTAWHTQAPELAAELELE